VLCKYATSSTLAAGDALGHRTPVSIVRFYMCDSFDGHGFTWVMVHWKCTTNQEKKNKQLKTQKYKKRQSWHSWMGVATDYSTSSSIIHNTLYYSQSPKCHLQMGKRGWRRWSKWHFKSSKTCRQKFQNVFRQKIKWTETLSQKTSGSGYGPAIT